jgi:hypothetical protein
MTARPHYGAWAVLASLVLIAGCDWNSDRSEKEERATGHVLPLQAVSLEGFLPEDATGGFIRFEAEHFAYQLPLTTTQPASVLAPIYVSPDGTLGSGKVSLFWLPAGDEASADASDGGTMASASSSTSKLTNPRPEGAVDLGLDLSVAALPKFAYTDKPGVLLHAFLVGARAFQEGAYRDAIASAAPAAQAELTKMRDDSIASLTSSIELIEAVRSSGAAESMGKLSFDSRDVEVGLSLESLTIADQLVAAFLIASRTGSWQSHVDRGSNALVAQTRQALFGDLVSEARAWFPRMTDELANVALERASQLSSAVGHATLAVGILGTLGVIAAPTALAATAIGAVSFFALTYAPAATAAVIRAAGNLVRGGGALNGYEYDSVAPSLKHVLSQNLSYCLGMAQDKIASKIAGVSKGAAVLTQLASAVSGVIDSTSSRVSSWLVDCAGDPSMCHSNDAADGGSGNGQGNDDDAGTTVGTCNEAQTAGGDTPESRTFDVGTNCADLTLTYDTLSVEDEITVSYEGKVVAGTGCVGASGSLPFSICGSSSEVLVSVTPNCAGGSGTAWSFTLQCPK